MTRAPRKRPDLDPIVAALAQRLAPMPHASLRDLSDACGVDMPAIRLMADGAEQGGAGNPLSASHQLRVAAALGVDPVTTLAIPPRVDLAEFDRAALGLFVRVRRAKLSLSNNQAAPQIGMTDCVLSRIENGHTVSITSTLKACWFIEMHPFEFMRPVRGAECFTGNVAVKGLKNKETVSDASCET